MFNWHYPRRVSFSAVILLLAQLFLAAPAQDLKGRVEESDSATRLPRPPSFSEPLNNSLEIHPVDSGSSQLPLSPLSGQSDAARMKGQLKAEDFQLPGRALVPEPAPVSPLPGRRRCFPCTGGGGESWRIPRQETFVPGDFGLTRWPVGVEPESMPCWGQPRVFGRLRAHRENISGSLIAPEPSGRLLAPETWRVPARQSYDESSQRMPQWVVAPAQESYTPAPPRLKEEQINWADWYARVAAALYSRWEQVGKYPGEARLRITVYRDKRIEGQIVNSAGQSLLFKRKLAEAVSRLNGDPVLSFPEKSQRYHVTFDADFQTGSDTKTGCQAVNVNDLESVRLR